MWHLRKHAAPAAYFQFKLRILQQISLLNESRCSHASTLLPPTAPCHSATNRQASVAAAVKINGKIYARFRFSLLLPLLPPPSFRSPPLPALSPLFPVFPSPVPLCLALRFYYERRFAASFDRWLQRRRGHAGYAAATVAATETATAAAAGTGQRHVKHGRWLA